MDGAWEDAISVRCRLAAAGLALLLGPAGVQAQDQHGQAVEAAFADGMTTAVGVAASGGVINPLGALLGTATKAVTFHRASKLPETEQPAAYAAASAMWMGSTVSNVCITAIFLTGGGFAPACLALGAAWGLKTWDDSEHERRFWERCAILRQFAVRQQVRCVYVPPKEAAAKEAAAKPQDLPKPRAMPKARVAAKQAARRKHPAGHQPPPSAPVPLPLAVPVAAPVLAVSREAEAP